MRGRVQLHAQSLGWPPHSIQKLMGCKAHHTLNLMDPDPPWSPGASSTSASMVVLLRAVPTQGARWRDSRRRRRCSRGGCFCSPVAHAMAGRRKRRGRKEEQAVVGLHGDAPLPLPHPPSVSVEESILASLGSFQQMWFFKAKQVKIFSVLFCLPCLIISGT